LAAALNKMRGTHLLVLAIDMPLMQPSMLRRMSENIGSGRGLLPKIGSRAEPLAAVYPRESLPAVRKALNSDDFAMQRLAENLTHAGLLKIFQVPESDVGFYRNLNDPTDLQSLSSEHVFSFNARSATESNV
jgi:molybdopterin-guanine dinucleotide biosynthesis protein A